MKTGKMLLVICLSLALCATLSRMAFAEEVVLTEQILQQKTELDTLAVDEREAVVALVDINLTPKVEECPIETKDTAKTLNDDVAEELNPNELDDPLYYANYGVYIVNDKLYYWVLKPLAISFKFALPEIVRIGFSNVFGNLREPVNFINSLSQFKFVDFAQGLTRFVFNSTVGLAGIFDVSCDLLDLCKKENDFGLTLAYWGMGSGPYFVLPLFGPTSLRDSIGLIVDLLLSPPTYLGYFFLNFLQSSGAMAFERTNNLSFGSNYEMLNSAVDPYTALKTAFEDCRAVKIKQAQ